MVFDGMNKNKVEVKQDQLKMKMASNLACYPALGVQHAECMEGNK